MTYGIWIFCIMYALGFALLQTITESAEDGDPNADLKLALFWPYIAVRVIIERIMYGDIRGDDE